MLQNPYRNHGIERFSSYLSPSYRRNYEKFCKEKGLRPNIVTFKSGFEAFWMGKPDAEYVFVYFHGR
jgi:hypothetical protein